MRITGIARRGPGGVDVAFTKKGDNDWYKIQGPLRTNIELLYNFLLSSEEKCKLFGRIYAKKHKKYKGNKSSSVTVHGGLFIIVLTRYEKNRNGGPNPSDKVNVELRFDSISNEEELIPEFEGGVFL